MRLILASASPRRSELLRAAGIECVVAPVEIDESPNDHEAPAAYVERLARVKARTGLERYPGDVVLGADTTVALGAEILGKPRDEAEAAVMLRRLSGRSHDVYTGIAVAARAREGSRVARTTVWMSVLTNEEIAWYIRSGEVWDKAGAYGIQGLASRFIPRIDGSYSNVVGLPVADVLQLVKDIALDEALGFWRLTPGPAGNG